METRYWLSIEGGKRRGTNFSIPEQGCLVGREAGCELQLPETTVSGKHASLAVEEHGVRVTDLDSRNGTRVNGQRVQTHLLAHGDRLSLGKLHLTLVDRRVTGGEGPEADTLVSGAAPSDASDRMMHADSARATKQRGLPPIVGVALLLALGAGGFYAWQLLRTTDAAPSQLEPVVLVPGDLLDDGSFEEASTLGKWTTEPSTSLELSSTYRHRGESGLGAELASTEKFRLSSPWVRIREGSAMNATASLRVGRDLKIAASWQLSSSSNEALQLELLGDALAESAEFREFQSTETMLPGFDRARLVFTVEARGDGEFALDDVALTEGERRSEGVEEFEEFELYSHGSQSTSASLVRIDRVAVSELQFFTESAKLRLEKERTPTGWTLRPGGQGASPRFRFLLSDSLAELGLATLHESEQTPEGERRGGRRRLSSETSISRVSGFLAGEGTLLLRIGFEQAVELEAKRTAKGWLMTTGPLSGAVALQLSFRDERNRAADIADAARRSERTDEPGKSLALWADLLEEVPFDSKLVAEAEARRGEQLRIGLDQVEVVRSDFERARFFELPDIYRRNLERTRGLQRRYAGSEVELQAVRLEQEIELVLQGYADEAEELDRAKLARIAEALEEAGASELAEHVRERAGSSAEDGGGY